MAETSITGVGITIAPENGDEIRATAADGGRFMLRIT
jgi:hypothetical protein